MKKKLLFESMTRIPLDCGWVVRVWRAEDGPYDQQARIDEIMKIMNEMEDKEETQQQYAERLINAIPEANAVEVLDEDGDGCVVYANWP